MTSSDLQLVQRPTEVMRHNPYMSRIREFPGRILLFDEPFAADVQAVRVEAASSGRVIVEIGSGSGNHLIACGAQTPEAILFGLEIRYKRCVRTMEKARARGVDNIRVLRLDARRITEVFLESTIDELYVLFPDPWPKRRERKNRILSPVFLDQSAGLLKPSGTITVKTDHREYFETFRAVAESDPRYCIERLSFDAEPQEAAKTEFESLFRSQHLPICQMTLRLCSGPNGAVTSP